MPRSINMLLNRYCLADVRLFNGTLRDYSPSARVPYQTSPNNAPFVKTVWGAQALNFQEKTGDCLLIPTPMTFNGQELSLEFTLMINPKIKWGGAAYTYSYLFNATGCYCLLFASNASMRFNCGTSLDAPASSFSTSVPIHIALTRDSSNNGVVYVNGVSVASGAVGAGTFSFPLGIMNNTATGATGTMGQCFLFRTYSVCLAADEVQLLSEASRIKFATGFSVKRSGIWSRI